MCHAWRVAWEDTTSERSAAKSEVEYLLTAVCVRAPQCELFHVPSPARSSNRQPAARWADTFRDPDIVLVVLSRMWANPELTSWWRALQQQERKRKKTGWMNYKNYSAEADDYLCMKWSSVKWWLPDSCSVILTIIIIIIIICIYCIEDFLCFPATTMHKPALMLEMMCNWA